MPLETLEVLFHAPGDGAQEQDHRPMTDPALYLAWQEERAKNVELLLVARWSRRLLQAATDGPNKLTLRERRHALELIDSINLLDPPTP